ncbi:MAG: FAD-binding protein [Propionibacterium sp.]|nr:FAD-binding protein [Propionibacterium sp.]
MITNWSRSVRFRPAAVARPGTEAELVAALTAAAERGQGVRVIGAGHSFTPLIRTDGLLISLDRLTGVSRVDPATGEVTLWGGTRIRDIAALLAPWGLALPNMGDIDAQSIAGAVSTGTHGTGPAYTGYSGMVTGLRLALPDGRVLDCSATEHPDLFAAARVGLGVLGVIVAVRLRCVPAFTLTCRETTEPIRAVLADFVDRARAADHLEFFWFPGTPRATVKQLTRGPADAPTRPMTRFDRVVNRELLGNVAFGALDAAAASVPRLAPAVRAVASRWMAGAGFSDASHRVYVAPRRVRFHETEYAMPLAAFAEVVPEVERAIVASGQQLTFPLEVRTSAADDTWLGTAAGRETVYVAVHRYHREPFAPLLAAVEPVFAAHAGRPHWGKEHSLTADDLAVRYPRFDDFNRVRHGIDPDGVLLGPYLRELLGV